MSALVAVAGQPLAPVDREWVVRATAVSTAAGPDGSDTRIEPSCGLGHALLRTSALDERQPLSIDGDLWLSGDVRLDDRDAVVRALGLEATPDGSDSRLVLRAYRAWGDRCLERLAGDFAFALWDGPRRRLLCARDQIGVAQLHYVRLGARILLATSVDALLCHPEIDDDLDEAAIADLLLVGHHRDRSATAFARVRQLPPAHALSWSDGSLRLWRYWELPLMEPILRFARHDEYTGAFRGLLDAAVADRVTCDRVAVQLSGGMDSTSIAASARTARGGSAAVRAVTAVLGAETDDREGEYASLVARKLGIDVDVVDVTAARPVDPLAAPAIRTPEPVPLMRTDFEYRFATVPARHSRVLLSGDGGDALLWFEPLYWLQWLAHGHVVAAGRALREPMRLSGTRPHPGLRTIARRLRQAREPAGQSVPAWLARDYVARTAAEPARARRQSANERDARTLTTAPLWTSMFRIEDPGFTGLPLRFRFPFFDLRLIRFVRSLAPEPWLVDKHILREAGRDRLPIEVLQRAKTRLVAAPAFAASTRVDDGMRVLVEQSPWADRFFDRRRLAATLADRDSLDRPVELALYRSLGLLHWLWHRRTP